MLEQFFKIEKIKNTEHQCTFVQSLLFEYFVLLLCTIETKRLFPPPTHISWTVRMEAFRECSKSLQRKITYFTCTLLLIGLIYVAKMYINSFFMNKYVNCIYFDKIFNFKIFHAHSPLLFISFLTLYAYITPILQFIVRYN